MTIHQDNEQVSSGSDLLTPQEQAICKQIATSAAPHSQRALALLALNEKSTQAQAAEQAGLSTGQVKYWIGKFRKQRLGVFPGSLLDELDAETHVELVTEIEEEPESVTEKVDSAEEKTKDMKAKRKKSEEKTMKDKKEKKGRKTKKTIKKTMKDQKDKKGKKTKKTIKKTVKDQKDKKGKKTKKTKKAKKG